MNSSSQFIPQGSNVGQPFVVADRALEVLKHLEGAVGKHPSYELKTIVVCRIDKEPIAGTAQTFLVRDAARDTEHRTTNFDYVALILRGLRGNGNVPSDYF